METDWENKVVPLCRQLIRLPSYSGQERELVEFLHRTFAELQFDEVSIDAYGSIMATMRGKRNGPKLLLDAHIDTVPVDNPGQWSVDPFGGEIREQKIYGRGASDMKGALSAMVVAVAEFAATTGKDFAGEITIAGVVHEECFEGIGATKIAELIQPDLVIIGEASELNLNIGQRGRAELTLETFGESVHSSNPEKGKNAVYAMCQLIAAIRKLTPATHPLLGKGILELTDIQSAPYPGASVVPNYCKATFDRRTVVGEDAATVLAPLQRLIETLGEAAAAKVQIAYGQETCYTGATIAGERFFPAWVMDRDHLLVRKVAAGLQKVFNQPVELKAYSFCTNGSFYAGIKGIPTVGFGPSRENLAHIVDEYVEITQLTGACKGYYGILESLT